MNSKETPQEAPDAKLRDEIFSYIFGIDHHLNALDANESIPLFNIEPRTSAEEARKQNAAKQIDTAHYAMILQAIRKFYPSVEGIEVDRETEMVLLFKHGLVNISNLEPGTKYITQEHFQAFLVGSDLV